MINNEIISSLLTFVTTYFLILIQRKFDLSQFIRQEGPKTHLSKKGTPTIGGLALWIGQSVALWSSRHDPLIYFYWKSVTAFAFIGLLDDSVKLLKLKNGLSAKNKFILQIAVAVFLLRQLPDHQSHTLIPGLGWVTLPLSLIYILYIFAFNGTTNATNLTDGLDGLLSTIMLGVWISLLIFVDRFNTFTTSSSLIILSSINISSLLTFLWFNSFKASIFMGDCGSLFLGAGICSVCVYLGIPLLLLGLLAIPVLETLSVIIQVASFRLRQKRVFKMTPFHHHYEQLGYHEAHITTRFSLINTVCCLATLLVLLPS